MSTLTQWASQFQSSEYQAIPRFYPKHIELSYSGLMSLSSCPRKLWLNKNMYSPWGFDDSPSTVCGKSYHHFFETYIATGDLDLAIFNAFKAYDFSILEGASKYDISTRNFWQMITAAIHTKDTIPYLSRGVRSFNGAPMIETPVSLILTHPSWKKEYHYRGYVDAVIPDPAGGPDLIVDPKTKPHTVKDSAVWEFSMSKQLLPYSMIVNHYSPSDPVSLPTDFLMLTMSSSDPKITTISQLHTPKDIDLWIKNLLDLILLMEKWTANLPHWPTTLSSCVHYERPCAYRGFCTESNDSCQEKILRNLPIADNTPLVPLISHTLDLTSYEEYING